MILPFCIAVNIISIFQRISILTVTISNRKKSSLNHFLMTLSIIWIINKFFKLYSNSCNVDLWPFINLKSLRKRQLLFLFWTVIFSFELLRRWATLMFKLDHFTRCQRWKRRRRGGHWLATWSKCFSSRQLLLGKYFEKHFESYENF